MQNRREFIKRVAAGSAFLAIPGVLHPAKKIAETRLVILHTSDVHSHIDPMPADHARYPGMGGFAQRAAQIQQVRADNEHVLLFDSGDFFQGTPYFNLYGGLLELKLMTKMGYDAATLGNHEFDNGMEHLAKQLQHAGFPIVNCNYGISNTPLEGKIESYKIFEKGGVRIGVIGLGIDPKGLVAPSNHAGLVWNDPILKGDNMAKYLKQEQNCHIVIALTHIGLRMADGMADDYALAANSSYIDIILGGHTHSFMDEAVLVNNAANKEVMIMHSGEHGVQMSRIDLLFSKGKLRKSSQTINTPA